MIGSSDITVTDLFCGAGGSSTGAKNALKGRGRVTHAANHWLRAIETHQLNHPDTEHDIADLQATHPSRYPKTTILWISPECTSHSLAKGRQRKNITQLDLWGDHKVDPEEERSRATMREVVEFTEYHRYEIVIVENVVDIRYWAHYEAWLTAMRNLGYDHKALYLNAQFFDVPQSRDRIYVVFWKTGNRAPDLDFRPPALCPEHGQINAVQVWKKPEAAWGRYGKNRQYTYRCPKCGADVKPFYRPAAEVIDWSIPSQRIGDRKQPLKPKTVERIKAGLRKFARPVVIDVAYGGQPGYVYPVDDTLPTQTARQTLGLSTPPFMLNYVNNEGQPRPVDEPLQTVGTRNTPPVVIPPFLVNYYTRDDAQSGIDQPMGTLTTEKRHALVIPPHMHLLHGDSTPVGPDDPLRVIVAEGSQHALITPPFIAVMKNSWSPDGSYIMPPRSLDEPLTTLVASASQHALITPFIAEMHGTSTARSVNEPMMGITSGGMHHALINPFITTYNNFSVYADVNSVMPTIPTLDRHALVECDTTAFDPADLIDSCGFRMLSPEELKLGMSFPAEYVITGNKREQVRQVGNAVACNVAEWIVERCVESLA